MSYIKEGDYVELEPRTRSPFADQKRWSWRVIAVHDYGIDVVYERALLERNGYRVHAFRNGVPFKDVTLRRPPSASELR